MIRLRDLTALCLPTRTIRVTFEGQTVEVQMGTGKEAQTDALKWLCGMVDEDEMDRLMREPSRRVL